MAYNIIRNVRTGYVSMVEKGRDERGNVVTKEYICGLGAMSHTEFKHFQKWAHGIKDQRMRKEMVMSCPLTITESKRAKEKVVGVAQQKTTVKRAPKKKVIDKVKEEEKAKKKVEEREKFRREYEKKHGIPKSEKLKKDVSKKVYATYKIDDLTYAQELEAEIKTLKGDKADKKLIQQREKKIKSILGEKYKTCHEVATAANKGEVFIDAL